MNGIAHNPEAIRYAYLGPIVKNEGERIKVSFSKAKAPAFVPDLLLWKAFEWTKHDVENLMMRPSVNFQLLIGLNREIQDQFEVRIALFWKQSLFLYKTGLILVFFNGTDAQVGVLGKGVGESLGDFACVHMATNPALRVLANERGDVAALGQNSFLHMCDNITAWLPKIVNDVDCVLDLHSTVDGKTFRLTTTQILHEIAGARLSPLDGIKWFLHFASLHLQECYRKCSSDETRYIVWLYYSVVSIYVQLINEEDDFVLYISGCHADANKPDETVYMEVQARLHAKFIKKMNKLRPHLVAPTEMALSFNNFPYFARKLTEFLNQRRDTLKGAIIKHADHCAASSNVRQAAINFFASIESETAFDFELTSLNCNLITHRTTQFNNAVREALTIKSPHHYPLILLKILELCAVRP
jgi:hypothetical protein